MTAIAAFQVGVPADAAAAVASMWSAAQVAARAGARLAVFPEALLADPLPLDSPEFETVAGALAGCAPALLFGMLERDGIGVHQSAVLLESGRLAGVVRKRDVAGEAGIAAGRGPAVLHTGGMRVGVGLCRDARDASAAARLADEGADALVYLLGNVLPAEVAARWRRRHVQVLAARARQTGRWVICADMIGRRGDAVGYGCTVAIDPSGRVHERVGEGCSGCVTAPVSGGIPAGRW